MSNIGKQPIILPDGVEANISNDIITIKGKKGELSLVYDKSIKIEKSESRVEVSRKNDSRRERSLHGLYRALINNMVVGVTDGYSKELHLKGVGYTAEVKGDFLLINAGFSHPVYLQIPDEITIEAPNVTTIIIKGINKQNVGDISAKIREIRKPEPYKGKGIKYSNEIIRRKAGKTVGAGA